MTEEQIKQNAENIVQKLSVSDEVVMYSRSNMITAAILGIHSRDEEIESLQRRVSMWKREAEVVLISVHGYPVVLFRDCVMLHWNGRRSERGTCKPLISVSRNANKHSKMRLRKKLNSTNSKWYECNY